MAALVYLVETLLSLALWAFLLRLLLQWARADFRKALSIDPEHQEAKAALEELARR